MKDGAIVTFTEDRHIFRVYGGTAAQCGFWWNLDAPTSDTETYFEDFAVCPEWNIASHIIRCTVPVGFMAIVGPGQSADCSDNSTLANEEDILQLNGDVCSVTTSHPKYTCEFCAANSDKLDDSACVEELVQGQIGISDGNGSQQETSTAVKQQVSSVGNRQHLPANSLWLIAPAQILFHLYL